MTAAPMPALPPAFARLGRVLSLATGFSLHVVAGPRDHCDSVFVRLVRAIGDEFLFVRHRVDKDGVQLLGALEQDGDERPRVVFLTGLERMTDAARRDATARLNVHRDTWATASAQVIVWLPAWELREFRDGAPDLFHWCRSLTVVHDADLPVRDEEEYLVWVCERLRGNARVPEVMQDMLADLRGEGSRIALHVRDGMVRSRMVRDLMFCLAGARLRRTAGLDVDAMVTAPGDGPAVSVVPVLVRSLDLAGALPGEAWAGLARAAGIPDVGAVAGLLGALAGRGELLVVVDAPDLLEAAGGWLEWLRSQARVRVCEIFADSPGAAAESVHSNGQPRVLALRDLLVRLFPVESDLRALAHYMFEDDDIAASLPVMAAVDETAARLIDAVELRGLLDRAFFEELLRMRPREAAGIEAVAAAWAAVTAGGG